MNKTRIVTPEAARAAMVARLREVGPGPARPRRERLDPSDHGVLTGSLGAPAIGAADQGPLGSLM
jgi:hypothetical protein